jgi:inner membrane protein
VDNLCHTLVGAALAEAGLRKRTPLATAALVIGANLPDVDGVAYFIAGPTEALGFRRGWTHGILAVPLWPFVLAGALVAWDRFVRRRRDPAAAPTDPRALWSLSALAVLTHPLLDLLNTYGVRLLMPFRDAWNYGDTLFIIDPWVWLALGTGYLLSSRRRRRGVIGSARPARWALGLSGTYVAVMVAGMLASRAVVRSEMAARGVRVDRLMVGPLPATPFRRQVVVASGTRYFRGTVDLLRRPRYRDDTPPTCERAGDSPEAEAASRTREAAIFLHWARFPIFVVDRAARASQVAIMDLRYTLDPDAGFGALSVSVPAAIPSSGASAIQEPHP